MTDWKDKNVGVLSPGYKGSKRHEYVVNEDNGHVAGFHIQHWDGKQDAVAQPDTVKLKLRMEE